MSLPAVRDLSLGFSSCPNDTFLLHAMLTGLVDVGPLRWHEHIADVEALNAQALAGNLDVTKLSFHAFMQVRDKYELLDTGAAFGFGCGPLLVATSPSLDARRARIAIPGIHTTACLLLRLWQPEVLETVAMRFDRIIPAVLAGEADAGVLIHEGRFVYRDRGLHRIVDLGEWWEGATGLPIPLGCFAVRKTPALLALRPEIERQMRASLDYAHAHPEASRPFVRSHAQESSDAVVDAHIELYVNRFTRSLGAAGRDVIRCIEERLPSLQAAGGAGHDSGPGKAAAPRLH